MDEKSEKKQKQSSYEEQLAKAIQSLKGTKSPTDIEQFKGNLPKKMPDRFKGRTVRMEEKSEKKQTKSSEEEFIARMKRLIEEHPRITESEDGFLIAGLRKPQTKEQ